MFCNYFPRMRMAKTFTDGKAIFGDNNNTSNKERMIKMNRTVGNVVKGVAVGMAVGAATYALTSTKKRRAKTIKKSAGQAIKNVGHMIDSVATMMK